jgi:release factor glutamine methyltransferase
MLKSIAETILDGAHELRISGVPEARREVGSLLAYVLGQDRSFILTHADDVLDEEQAETFRKFLKRRANREPLQYITGHQEFFGLDFEVTPDVLIPRPETELLVEKALNLFDAGDAPLICDVGTGSGCITITLLNKLRQASVVSLDISEAALTVARRNASYHAVADRVEFFRSDCFEAVRDTHQFAFDLIVSNPPYVETCAFDSLQQEVRDFEPQAALFGGEDGLSVIRRLLSESANFLKPQGFFLFEIGFNQAAAVETLIDRKTWQLIKVYPDLQGIPRTVALQKNS